MIHRVFSDLPHFKTLVFRSGLNVLLAEKSDDATRQQTRNRAGKSSLVQLIRFLTGGDKSIFGKPPLVDSWFGMEFDLGGERVCIEMTGAPRARPRLDADPFTWPEISVDKVGRFTISKDAWKARLRRHWFDLSSAGGAWAPKLGSLRAWFMRTVQDGGMLAPTRHFSRQSLADEQVNLAYLLGLDWTIARDWQGVRDQENALKVMRRGLKDGALGEVIATASDLNSQVIIERARTIDLRARLADFRVVEEYHALEAEAADLTRHMGVLADQNMIDRRYLLELEQALTAEAPPTPHDLEALYAEVGVILPGLVQRRFDEVARFHTAVVANRQGYLQEEHVAARRRITDRDTQQRRLDQRRGEVMAILEASGALEHFAALQAEASRVEAKLEVLKQKQQLAEAIETGELTQTVRRAGLETRLRRDLQERAQHIGDAVLIFEEISRDLYGRTASGRLIIEPTSNGPRIDVQIQGSRSRGVGNMQIFCFDMMLTILNHRRGRGPGFLVHDSHLFDGVDERQVAMALALGARYAERYGFQYIVTLNTDDLPGEAWYPDGFSINEHLVVQRLSDAEEDGGLFGFRFESL